MPNKDRIMRNGVRSADMGIVVTEQPDIIRPEKRLPAAKNVPGRIGSLTISEGDCAYDTFTVFRAPLPQIPTGD